MPSKKGLDQALTWLKSKMAERDTLDAINAEICYNVIMDLKDKRKVIEALYHQAYTELRRKNVEQERLNNLEKASRQEELYATALEAMRRYSEKKKYEDYSDQIDEYERLGYTRIQMNEKDLADIFDRGDEW